MNSYAVERELFERLLSDFLYRRKLATEAVENNGPAGPAERDAVLRLRQKADELKSAIDQTVHRAAGGFL